MKKKLLFEFNNYLCIMMHSFKCLFTVITQSCKSKFFSSASGLWPNAELYTLGRSHPHTHPPEESWKKLSILILGFWFLELKLSRWYLTGSKKRNSNQEPPVSSTTPSWRKWGFLTGRKLETTFIIDARIMKIKT